MLTATHQHVLLKTKGQKNLQIKLERKYYSQYILEFNIGTSFYVLEFDIHTSFYVLEFDIRTLLNILEVRISNLST
jgi:hypothetical protein